MTETLSENYGREPEDICPKCKSRNLEFSSSEEYEEGKYYQVKCLKCSFVGQQHYNLTFACFTDNDGVQV